METKPVSRESEQPDEAERLLRQAEAAFHALGGQGRLTNHVIAQTEAIYNAYLESFPVEIQNQIRSWQHYSSQIKHDVMIEPVDYQTFLLYGVVPYRLTVIDGRAPEVYIGRDHQDIDGPDAVLPLPIKWLGRDCLLSSHLKPRLVGLKRQKNFEFSGLVWPRSDFRVYTPAEDCPVDSDCTKDLLLQAAAYMGQVRKDNGR